jgi:hypothetical protein
MSFFLGWLAYAGAYLAFAVVTAVREVWACFLAYALYHGLADLTEKALAANLAGGARKGLAYGWYNFAIGVATCRRAWSSGRSTRSAGGWRRPGAWMPLPWSS